MADLMNQRREFLGWLHPGKQSDFSAMRQTLGRADLVGVAQFDALRFHELHQPFSVARDIALYFGQRGKIFAFGLAEVLSRDLRPSLCALDVIPE